MSLIQEFGLRKDIVVDHAWPVDRELNRIAIHKMDQISVANGLLRAVYQGTEAFFTDFSLDFGDVGVAYADVCAPIAGIIDFYSRDGIDFSCNKLPSYLEHAGVLSPFSPSTNADLLNTSCFDRVWRFTSDEVSAVTTAFVRQLVAQLMCEEGVFRAVEWSINEVMDNVFQHSQADHGFIRRTDKWRTSRKRRECTGG